MSTNPDRLALERLADALVEDYLTMPDDELLAEMIEDGEDPAELATRLRARFEQAVQQANEENKHDGSGT